MPRTPPFKYRSRIYMQYPNSAIMEPADVTPLAELVLAKMLDIVIL